MTRITGHLGMAALVTACCVAGPTLLAAAPGVTALMAGWGMPIAASVVATGLLLARRSARAPHCQDSCGGADSAQP